MLNRKTLIIFIVSVLILAFAAHVSASGVGETISIEGYVDSAGKNSLYVSGKILVANEYSSISTGGTNIFVGDYVMGFIYLNEDMQSYTIVSLTKIPERSIGTPTPLPQSTATPVWADLFMTTPTAFGGGLHLLSDGQSEKRSDLLWDPELFGTDEPAQTAVPTATPSSLAFEGVVSEISGNKIVIDGTEYVTDNATGYKDKNSEINQGDYIRGRAAPYPGALIIRYIEVLSDYERSDLEIKTVWGLFQSQDTAKMIVSLPDGDIEALFFPGTKMSKTFYTKGTLISMDLAGSYVKESADYPLVQSGDELTPINGIIDEIICFSDNETYFVSSNLAYFVNSDVKYIPDSNAFEKGAPFVGLMKNGRVTALYFTDNNRVKTINGLATSVRKNQAGNGIDFYVGGVEYHITPDTVVLGNNLVRHSEITGYADSSNNVFYMTFRTPWYSQFKDWNWTVIIPASVAFLSLVFFLLLHRTKTEGFLQEVNGNIITLTDARGENKRHFRCSDEISRYVSSLITMKVELTIIEKKYQDSSELLNLSHWWDSGLVFDAEYFRLRDEINKYQLLLGFPEWNTVKTFYRDVEYIPVSLADTFCDYMIGIRLFSFRKIPSEDIQFDVPAYLDLQDIRIAVRFDILWRRSRVYKSKSQNLKPGLVAEQLVPSSHYANAEQIRRERMILRDIRMPLIGVDYVRDSGEKFRIDSLSCCTFPANTGTSAWKESDLKYDPVSAKSFLSRLNYYGLEYLSAVKQNLYIPRGLVKNDMCASCSFLSDCFYRKDKKDPQTAMEDKDAGILSSFLETLEEKAALCGDKSKVMDLLIETLSLLDENPSLRMINKLSNAAINLKHDLSGGKDASS